MKLFLFLSICLAGSTPTQAVYSSGLGSDSGGWGGGGHKNGGWGGGMTVSKKDVGASGIYQQVRDILDQATQGITAADLEAAAESVQISADVYVDDNGGVVSSGDVMAAIDEVAATFNGAVAVSALFDTPLIFEASVLDSAFCLWEGLVEKAEQLEAAGESPVAVIAAISMTATSIQVITVNSVGLIIHQHLKEQEGIDVPPEEVPARRRKRWEAKGEVSHGPGGTSGKVSVGHSWKRRRATSSEKTPAQRKRWEAKGEVSHGPGGTSGKASVSHSWKRSLDDKAVNEEDPTKRAWGGDRPGGGRPGGGRPGGGRPGGGRPGGGWTRGTSSAEKVAGRRKRWEAKGEVSHGPGGTSGKASVSHSWKRSLDAKTVQEEDPAKRIWGGDRPGGGRPGGGRPGGGRPGGGWRREVPSEQDGPGKRVYNEWDRGRYGLPAGRGWRRDETSVRSVEKKEVEDPAKRAWGGGAGPGGGRPGGGGPGGGRPGGGRPGGGWKRSESSAEKRGKWSGGVEAGYSSSGGASVGGRVSYSWRRR